MGFSGFFWVVFFLVPTLDIGAQGHTVRLLPLLQGRAQAEPPPAPPALSEGRPLQGSGIGAKFHVSRRGECGAGGAQLISGCGGGSPCQGMLLMLF